MFKRLAVTWMLIALFAGQPTLAEALRDPTRPPQPQTPAATAQAPLDMSLDSILTSDDRRVAVINGQAVREGDHIGNARVQRIGQDRVLLRINRTTRTLTLESTPSVRQP